LLIQIGPKKQSINQAFSEKYSASVAFPHDYWGSGNKEQLSPATGIENRSVEWRRRIAPAVVTGLSVVTVPAV
jgi:hypothetical protein